MSSFFPRPECRESTKMSKMPHQIVQVLTGHSFLNAHQHRLGFKRNPNCICSPTPETVEHFIFNCSRFQQQRKEFQAACLEKMDIWPPNINSLHKYPSVFREMSRFVRRTNRLEYPEKPRRRLNQQSATR